MEDYKLLSKLLGSTRISGKERVAFEGMMDRLFRPRSAGLSPCQRKWMTDTEARIDAETSDADEDPEDPNNTPPEERLKSYERMPRPTRPPGG